MATADLRDRPADEVRPSAASAEGPASAPTIMIVDDDPSMRTYLAAFLSERGYASAALDDAERAVRQFEKERPAAVIIDVEMPGGMNGLDALAAFKKIDRDVPIIMLSGQGRTSIVVQAMKLGAADFVTKPFDDHDLETPLANALKQHQLNRELAALRAELLSQTPWTLLFGNSERMREVRELVERVADTDVTVLIRGESGTGKELVARAVHASSSRRDNPFVRVNCAALPAELLESELFGYERGAFGGALQPKPGKLEFGNHGTMFLDEISQMSAALQTKLLHVLQGGEFSRLGGKSEVRVDVRIVAATNRDLERMVTDGQFRQDLFFRLNVVAIVLPPLRERREEIPALADYFVKKYSVQYNRPHAAISPTTMHLFMEYDWPGNVRELENLVRRAVVLGSEAPIQRDVAHTMPLGTRGGSATLAAAPNGHDGHPSVAPEPSSNLSPTAIAAAAMGAGHYALKAISRTAARQAERELIVTVLQRTRWNRKETAAILGISYKALLYKIKENGLDKAS